MTHLSVILPVLNGEAHLRGALRSTLRAMPKHSVLAVCDDGSTDGTRSILESFDDNRLLVVTHNQPRGVAAALNSLIEATDSQFIARMDADDVCLPWRFRMQFHQMTRGYDGVFSTMIRLRERRLAFEIPISLSPQAVAASLLVENSLAHPTAMLRRSALEAVGSYRPSPAEDWDLWLRLASEGASLARFSTPTVAYRIHNTQATAATRWAASLRQDPNLRDAYTRLAGIKEPDWFDSLLPGRQGREGLYGLETLRQLVEHRMEGLRPLERRFLLHRFRTVTNADCR